MKKRFWRAALLTLLIATCIALLGGCFWWEPFMENGTYIGEGNYTGSDMRESITEGYFKLTIDTSKDEYVKGEAIDCWAEIEYIGDQDSITVYVYDSPIEMDMTGERVSYSSSPSWSQSKTLKLQKGVPVRVTLSESIPKSKSVLPGQYEIDAYASVSLSQDGAVSYDATVSAVIVVKE